jgi:hypothetical protein
VQWVVITIAASAPLAQVQQSHRYWVEEAA